MGRLTYLVACKTLDHGTCAVFLFLLLFYFVSCDIIIIIDYYGHTFLDIAVPIGWVYKRRESLYILKDFEKEVNFLATYI